MCTYVICINPLNTEAFTFVLHSKAKKNADQRISLQPLYGIFYKHLEEVWGMSAISIEAEGKTEEKLLKIFLSMFYIANVPHVIYLNQ